MNPLPAFAHSGLATTIGWTLLHFLWQATVIAFVTGVILKSLVNAGPRLRYGIACMGLAAVAAAPLVTLVETPETWVTSLTSAKPVERLHSVPSESPGVFEWPATEHRRVEDAIPWLTVAWLAGVGVLAIRLLGGWVQTHRLRSTGVQPADPAWPARLRELQRRFGIHEAIPLLESTRVYSPMVLGWLKPVILVPSGLACGLPPSQVEALLAHELAHIVRHDVLVNLLQRLVETALFYHPAVWWLSEVIRHERELCCDELAASTLLNRTELAHALVALAEQQVKIPGLAVAADGGHLGQRVRRLLGAPSNSSPAPGSKRTALLGLFVALVAAAFWVWPRFTAPALYKSIARVQLAPTSENDGAAPGTNFDPYWIATQVELFRSDTQLSNAVSKLKLNEKWADGSGRALSPAGAMTRLRRHLSIRQIRNTQLVEICAADRDPGIAEVIANTVAELYLSMRFDRELGRVANQRLALKKAAISAESEVVMSQVNLDNLEREKKTENRASYPQEEILRMTHAAAKRAFESAMEKLNLVDEKSILVDQRSNFGGLGRSEATPFIVDRATRSERASRWVYSRE